MRYSCFLLLAALCVLPCIGYGQGLSLPIPEKNSKEWRRLSGGPDATTDVGVSTLVLEPNGVLRATFRIALFKSESADEKPGVKYKVRLVTIQFDARKKEYRVFETTLLDSSEKVVYASGPNPAATWKPIRGGNSYFSAASNLSPLGLWKVTSASDARALAPNESAPDVAIMLDRFQVGFDTCPMPSYESASMTRDEVAKLTGLSTANGAQLDPEKVGVVKIKCESPNVASETHILILKSVDRAILVSGGTLYALAK